MSSLNIIKEKIIKLSTIKNIKKGYTENIKDNILDTISINDFEDDLNAGDGNEINDSLPNSKFKALYSSSALVVNFFGYFKRNHNSLSLFGVTEFNTICFEKKLPTGLKGTPPHLDFFLENETYIIGIESKYLEILTPKEPKFSDSYSNAFLMTIDKDISELVNYYKKNNEKTHLDTAQLIKHAIGLIKNKVTKQAKLVYVYWEPINFDEYVEYEIHRNELVEFSKRIKKIKSISFESCSYQELYEFLIKNKPYKTHLNNFKEKYLI